MEVCGGCLQRLNQNAQRQDRQARCLVSEEETERGDGGSFLSELWWEEQVSLTVKICRELRRGGRPQCTRLRPLGQIGVWGPGTQRLFFSSGETAFTQWSLGKRWYFCPPLSRAVFWIFTKGNGSTSLCVRVTCGNNRRRGPQVPWRTRSILTHLQACYWLSPFQLNLWA